MKKIIDEQFQHRVAGMMADGVTKRAPKGSVYGAAKKLGVSRPTIRRALAALAGAMAQAGQGHCVYVGDVIPPPGAPAVPALTPSATPMLALPMLPALALA